MNNPMDETWERAPRRPLIRGTWWQWLILAIVGLTVLTMTAGLIVTLAHCKPAPVYRFRSMSEGSP